MTHRRDPWWAEAVRLGIAGGMGAAVAFVLWLLFMAIRGITG